MASDQIDFKSGVDLVRNGQSASNVAVQLVGQLTIDEKLYLLTGPIPFWPGLKGLMGGSMNDEPYWFGAIERLGIPGVRFCDGPRGVVVGKATSFPVAMARGATWDTALEEEVGVVFAREARAYNANMSGAACINLPRHPAWGRAQETYGEDPILLGEFGIAITKGLQNNGVISTVKHFAVNSMEDMRFKIDVEIDDAALHEVYLPHFEMTVKEGNAMSVMSAYNAVNGEWCGQNEVLLNDILRDEWKFKYFVISDWVFGIRDSAKSLRNGCDLEAPFLQIRSKMKQELDAGEFTTADVEQAVARILTAQLDLYSKRTDPNPDRHVIFCQDHRNMAREVAARTMVLLKNDPVITRSGDSKHQLLPLDPKKMKKVALIGNLADTNNTGDWGSSYVSSPSIVTPYQGIKSALSAYGTEVILSASDDIRKAESAAKEADMAIVVVGYGARDEGENLNASTPMNLVPFPTLGQLIKVVPFVLLQQIKERLGFHRQGPSLGGKAGGDRKSVRLPPKNVDLIRAVQKANPRTVVVMVSSGAVIVDEWIDDVNTVLMSWYSGCEGGDALADVLLGQVDTSGRLPFSVPKDESHLPYFDATATKITYDKWFGQRLLDKKGIKARFPLGYGMSYTSFQIHDLDIDQSQYQAQQGQPTTITTSDTSESIQITTKVTNTGPRPGRHVIQVYGVPHLSPNDEEDFPTRVLMGFSTTGLLQPNETKSISVKARTRPLKRWVVVEKKWALASREVEIEVGAFAGDRAVCAIVTL